MATWLILQQTSYEGLGNIGTWLQQFNQKYEIIKLWEDSIPAKLEPYSGLIVMGGSMSANDDGKYPFLSSELEILEKWLQTDRPLLGVCLGSQLLAKALGSRVYRGDSAEIGWYPLSLTEDGHHDPVLKTIHSDQKIFQWHGETFDLPQSVTLLASSPQYKNQAFKYGEHVYGLQFHPEMTKSLIANWIEIHKQKLIQMNANLPQKILQDTQKNLPTLEHLGQQIIQYLVQKIHES